MITEHAQFFTATILNWNNLLLEDRNKNIVINSLSFLVNNKRVIVYGFVIMPNHIHVIWQMRDGHEQSDVQRDFLKYTAQQLKFELQRINPELLLAHKVNVKDRQYQIWEHRPLSIPLLSESMLEQKLEYIHRNPIQPKWQLADIPENYHYSSARFYYLNENNHSFISHYKG
jgi:REP element-mobilizing transposase RayT